MRIQPDKTTHLDDMKKPGRPQGLPGLLIYGALTILAILALVVVANT